MAIKLTCPACGYSWDYNGSKRPLKREGKPARSVPVSCPGCGGKVYLKTKDVDK